jgi:hypothetical protein
MHDLEAIITFTVVYWKIIAQYFSNTESIIVCYLRHISLCIDIDLSIVPVM